MKHLKKFENNSSYEEYILSEDFITPNVSYIEEDSGVYYNPLQSSNNDPYADYLKLVYNVENTDEPTNLFYYYYWDEEDNGGIDLSLVDKMIVDGNEISPVTEYHFQSTGEHEVYVKFVDQTTIPREAFFRCSEIATVTIPKSVTTIGESVFENCEGLQSVSIGEGVQTIGDAAFSSCNKLTSIVVDPNNVTYDSRNNCNAIMETATNTLIVGCNNTIIPQDCQTIRNNAFYGCSGLTKLNIPNSVTSIGEHAFTLAGSGEGSELIWSENASVIKKSTFWSCLFERVIIPEGVTVIEKSAFNSSYYLKEITVPNSVTFIGDGAFECCWSLEKITFGTGVQQFETGVFGDCEELMDIHFLSTTPPQVSAEFLEDLWGMNRGVIYVPRGCIDNYADWVTPVEEQNWTIAEELFVINSADKSNGVYIITTNGELVDKTTVTTDAVGVALITDNQRIMIAKNNATDDGSNYNLYWGKNLYGKDVTSLQNSNYDYALADFTGYENTQKIISFYTEDEDEIKMDSKDMCKVVETLNKGKNSQSNEGYRDWYVPAAGQLYEMWFKQDDINTALTNISGITLESNGYWSSSEDDALGAWSVDFDGGYVDDSGKDYGLRVRFIRDI